MPTLLRFLIGLIAIVYLQAAIAATVVVTVASRDEGPWSFVAAGTGSALLVLVPMTAGLTVSYIRWSDPDARRRLRRLLWVGVVVQLLGAALTLLGSTSGAGAIVSIVEIVLAIALDVAFVAIGRAARKRDRLWHTGDEWVDTTAADIRKGWRNAAIGFVIGLAAAALLTTLLLATLNPRHRTIDLQITIDGLSFAFMGAAFGLLSTAFRITRRMRLATGGDFSSARRIGRVVLRGKTDPLTPDEAQRAARYARVVRRWLPYQTAQFAFLYTGIVLIQVSALSGRNDSFNVVRIAEVVLLVAIYVVLTPLLLSRARRATAFAREHPLLGPESIADH